MNYIVGIGERKFEVAIDDDKTATIDGRKVNFSYRKLRNSKLFSILIDGTKHEFVINRANGGFDIWYSSRLIQAEVNDEKTERLKQLMGAGSSVKGPGSLKAPMPGLVLKIEIEVGQNVERGDGLVIMEAMKMENELKAHGSAVIKEIKVKPGQPVEKNQILVVFE